MLPSSTPAEFARLGRDLLPLLVTRAVGRSPEDYLQTQVFPRLACVDMVGRVMLLLLEGFHVHQQPEAGAQVVARHLAAMCSMVQESVEDADAATLARALALLDKDALGTTDQHTVAREVELHCLRVLSGVLQQGQDRPWAEQVRAYKEFPSSLQHYRTLCADVQIVPIVSFGNYRGL